MKLQANSLILWILLGILILGMLGLLILLQGGEPKMAPEVKDRLDQAKTLYSEGKFAEAEALYLQVLELDSKNTKALKGLGVLALWNNRLQEAERYLKQALRFSSLKQKIWPFNASLQGALGLTYYRMNRFAEAAEHFQAAAGLGFGPFAPLKAYGRHLAAFGNTTPYVIKGPEESRVLFVITDPLPVVQIRIGSSEPVNFLIDTGAAEIMLEPELARAVGTKLSGKIMGVFAGGKKAPVGLGKVDSVAIGDFLIENVPINTLENPLAWQEMSELFGLKIRGVIGTLLLYQFLSTIYYANGALILRRKTQENLKRFEVQAEVEGAKVIPFWMTQLHLMFAWGTVNGKGPYLFSVDTGLEGKGFTAPESILKEAGITVDWAKAREGIGGGGRTKEVEFIVEELTLGTGENQVVENNIAGVAIEGDEESPDYQQGFRVGGVISHQFFRKYALTFDFSGMRLFLERPSEEYGGGRGPVTDTRDQTIMSYLISPSIGHQPSPNTLKIHLPTREIFEILYPPLQTFSKPTFDLFPLSTSHGQLGRWQEDEPNPEPLPKVGKNLLRPLTIDLIQIAHC